MNIVIIGPAYPFRGGISAFAECLARQYQREGHSVQLFTFTLQYPKILFPGKTQYSTDPAPKDLNFKRCINSCNPFNWYKVGKELKRLKPDIVIFSYWLSFMAPCMGTIAKFARKNSHTKTISLTHNIIPHESHFFDKWFSKYFVKQMDGFVAMSHSVVEDISLFDKTKPRQFCPHPIYDHYGELIPKSEARQMLNLNIDGRYVLFFGFIRAYKGLDLLLEALSDNRLREMNIRLIVAGEFYDEQKPYMDKIEELHIADRVIMRNDFIPDKEVNRYFCSCDIVALPYKSATQSGVTQIAFHFEKPMLVTNVGGLAEIVPNGKIGYVVETDAKKIADALVDYYSNDREQEFTYGVIEEKKKYSWSNMTAAISKLIK